MVSLIPITSSCPNLFHARKAIAVTTNDEHETAIDACSSISIDVEDMDIAREHSL